MIEELYLNGGRVGELWDAVKKRSIPTKAVTLAEYNALTEEEKRANVQYIITDNSGSDSTGGGTNEATSSIKYKDQTISGAAGKDATINGENTLTIQAGENVSITQQDGVLIINVASIPTSVQEYDTDDGWHVRKYSDGYLEMSHMFNFSSATWGGSGTFRYSETFSLSFPIEPLKLYSMNVSVIGSEGETSGSWGWPLAVPGKNVYAVASNYPRTNEIFTISVHVTGRWKSDGNDITPTGQTTLVTSKVDLPQTMTVDSSTAASDAPLTVTFPSTTSVASLASAVASISNNNLLRR